MDDAKRAAAEARRQKILARGRDRLATITGTAPTAARAPSETRPGALAEAAAAPAPLEPGQLAAPAPPAAGAGLAAGPKAEAPPAQGEQAPAIQAQPANGAAAPPAAWLAGEFAARLKESRSASSLSEASSVARQRKAGTSGTGARWTSYEHAAAPPKPCTAAAPSPPATPAEALSAAVVATALLRLLVAALLAVLTAVAALGPGVAADSPGQMEGQEQQQQQQLGVWAWAGLAAAWQQQQQRLPPVANLVALDASIIAAAYLLLCAMPGLARARTEGPGPGLLMRVAALVPGLVDSLAIASAWQQAAAGVMDDVATFVVTLVACHLAPQAWPPQQ